MPNNIITQEFNRYRGDSASLSIPLTDPDTGSAFNPVGSVLIFSLKGAATDADEAALVQKISAIGGITVANPSVVSLVPADHAALPARVTFEFDIQAQNGGTGAVKTVARGTLFFYDDVTKEVTLSIPTTTTNPDAGYTWDQIAGKPDLLELVDPPATSGADGEAGQCAFDNDYFYVCVATSTWRRFPLNDWA